MNIRQLNGTSTSVRYFVVLASAVSSFVSLTLLAREEDLYMLMTSNVSQRLKYYVRLPVASHKLASPRPLPSLESARVGQWSSSIQLKVSPSSLRNAR